MAKPIGRGGHLTEAEKELIRLAYRDGQTQSQIAADRGCSLRAVVRHFEKLKKAGEYRGPKRKREATKEAGPQPKPANPRYYRCDFVPT